MRQRRPILPPRGPASLVLVLFLTLTLSLSGCKVEIGSSASPQAPGTTSSPLTSAPEPPSPTAEPSDSTDFAEPTDSVTPPTTNAPTAPPVDSEVLASAPIEAATGGTVSADGVTLTVPPDVLSTDGTATISLAGDGVYDLSVDQSWTGQVEVTVPLANEDDLVIHQVDGEWIAESDGFGEETVQVDSLSPFSRLTDMAKGAVCLKSMDKKKIASCLLGKGITAVSAKLAHWIAEQIGPGCLEHLTTAGGAATVALKMFTGACVGQLDPGTLPPPSPKPQPQPQPQPQPGNGSGGGSGGGSAPQPPAAAQVSLSKGSSAPNGSWYAVSLGGFASGSSVILTCHDSADPGGFFTQQVTIGGNGGASAPNLCYSSDGPDHWVTTSNGVTSNRVTWGGGGAAPPPVQAPAGTRAETVGSNANTWTNHRSAGGNQGATIPRGTTVEISCRLEGFKVENGNTWWYRIASTPWNNGYYVSADAFYNNGATSGDLRGTPWVDEAVPVC